MAQSTNLRRLIIEFIHPGDEFNPGKNSTKGINWDNSSRCTGIRLWNDEKKHKRKFLLSRGKYRESPRGIDVESPLTFWGEWEPQSRVKKIGDTSPIYVHKPFLEKSTTGNHNTDPFVFGSHFWFTNCHQFRYHKLLKSLDIGSLIIFGTVFKKGFALDTVFVVGERWSPAHYLRCSAIYPEQLRSATLDHKDLARDPKNAGLVFFRGKPPADDVPFSFVPCQPVDSAELVRGHERPNLCKEKFILSGILQGCSRLKRTCGSVESRSCDEILEYWNGLTETCRAQGFLLGHSIELPPICTGRIAESAFSA